MNRYILLAGLVGLLAAMAVACGGNGENIGPSGAPRMTDPATVPMADRVPEDQVYLIRDGGVTAPSGASSTLPERNTGQPGDENGGEQNGNGSSAPSGQTYTVESGDTCSAIARSFDISLDELLSANPQIDPECRNIQVGNELRIPEAAPVDPEPTPEPDDDEPVDEPTPTPEPSSGSGQEYVVQSGDICGSIANQFGVDVEELIALNDLNCNNMQIGDVILIP